MRGMVLVMALLMVAGPAVADSDPPWGRPDCPAFISGKPTMQPYAPDRATYTGIYLAVEGQFAPIAAYFFPVLRYEEHRNWVRITRTTRNGARPPDYLTVFGNNHSLRGDTGAMRQAMKIDKCTGAVLERITQPWTD